MKVILNNVRLAFPVLFTPEAFQGQGAPYFSAVFLIPKGSEQHRAVEAKAIEALEIKFPGKGKQVWAQIQGNNNRCCIQDGDKTGYDGFEGHIAVRAKNAVRPLVIDADKTPLTQADGKPYSGCYVTAAITFFGYDNTGRGLSASLGGVQFARDGDPFAGGRAASADDFEDISAGADAAEFV